MSTQDRPTVPLWRQASLIVGVALTGLAAVVAGLTLIVAAINQSTP